MLSRLLGLLAPKRDAAPQHAGRQRLSAAQWPAVIYAVGDVHGCLAQLRLLEKAIIDDSRDIDGEKWIVYLGDYVDRGPDSAGVLDHLTGAAPHGFRRICLAGNHEIMMLDYVQRPRPDADWLSFGGLETLYSYGISGTISAEGGRRAAETLASHIPLDHLEFLADLPVTLSVPGVVFVHAGLRPGIEVNQQNEHDLVFIRDEFFEAPAVPGRLVVHGHTPAAEAVVTEGRICVDTGAFATGTLTAVRLSERHAPRLLSVTN